MAEPFLGEIREFGFNFAPKGWAQCNGQLLPINQFTAVFSILGTTYGGDGRTNFALPDLRGRMPVHQSFDIALGQAGGVESVTLTASNLPPHGHNVMASADLASSVSPASNVMGAKPRFGVNVFAAASNLASLAPGAVHTTGSSQPHDNVQPSLVVNFCIALAGIFPSRN